MFLKKKGGAVEWLVVCLGNPGIQYSSTRHNVGFHAADALEERCGVRLNRLKFQALTGEVRLGGSRVLVLKPQTMMNRSGQAVQQAADTHRLFRWKTSTFTSQVTSMQSAQLTTYLQP